MKKIFVIFISALLIVTCLTGTASAGETDLTGTWYLASAVQDGMELDAGMLSAMGMNITLVLNEDGTAVMEMNGAPQEGTWDPEGNIAFTENPSAYEIVDGKLKFTVGEGMMVFSREKAEVKETVITPIVEDPQPGDFDGTWNAVVYNYMGMDLPLQFMGCSFGFTLRDGVASYTETLYDMNDNYAVTDVIEKEFPASLSQDGTLFIDFCGEDVLSKVMSGASGFTCTLHEDNMLTATIPEIEEQMEMLQSMSSAAENENAEEAPVITIETEGDSEGGSSGGYSFSAFFIFEKAE